VLPSGRYRCPRRSIFSFFCSWFKKKIKIFFLAVRMPISSSSRFKVYHEPVTISKMPPKKAGKVELLPKDWDDLELVLGGAKGTYIFTFHIYFSDTLSIIANSTQIHIAQQSPRVSTHKFTRSLDEKDGE
jgi:hypothetical protein